MSEIITIKGVECFEKNGTAYLNLETVARGLGFTQIAASGNEVVRWERVRKYLSELNVPTCGDDGYIPENIFYRLAMKAKNETAEAFQAKIADEVIPTIRKTGSYSVSGQEFESRKKSEAEAKLNNSRARVSAMWLKLANTVPIPEYKSICTSYASTALAGKEVLPLPEVVEHTYTAEEIGNMFGVSKQRIGRVANANNLKTDEYGKLVWDKSPYCSKQLEAFRYNQHAVDKFTEIFSKN